MAATRRYARRALAARTVVAAAEPPAAMHWRGAITVEGRMTGDGRGAESGAWTWDTPFPLTWQREGGGHDGATVVGTVWEVWRDGDLIMGRGTFDLGSDEGREAARHVAEGLTNDVSIEPDSIDAELRVAAEVVEAWDQPMDDEFADDAPERDTDDEGRVILDAVHHDDMVEVVTAGRIRTLAMVTTAAYDEATIELEAGLTLDGLLAGDVGQGDPAAGLAKRDKGDDYQAEDPAEALGGAREALSEAAGALGGDDPDLEVVAAGIGTAIEAIDVALGMIGADEAPEPEPEPEPEDQAAAVVAAAVPAAPPAGWFDDPELDGPTPLQVTDDGRVYGHLATWGTCHIGRDDVCLTPPNSEAAYAYFATGEVVAECGPCDDGATLVSIPTGTITMGTGHAELAARPRQAMEHYDNTGAAVADVAAGEDAYGIWVAGALRPTATEDQVRALRGSSLSGDWRRIGGALELVAALAVNVPGFPIPRAVAASAGLADPTPRPRARHTDVGTLALVAAGTLTREVPTFGASDTDPDAAASLALARSVKRLERLVAPQLAASLRREVHGERPSADQLRSGVHGER